jgi:hypothetical protein
MGRQVKTALSLVATFLILGGVIRSLGYKDPDTGYRLTGYKVVGGLNSQQFTIKHEGYTYTANCYQSLDATGKELPGADCSELLMNPGMGREFTSAKLQVLEDSISYNPFLQRTFNLTVVGIQPSTKGDTTP